MSKTNIPKGFPMGIKVNLDDLIEGLTIEKLIEVTQVYHNNCYIIGKDTSLCDKAHYHIHWFSAKDTTEGAMKTFRSNVIKKQFPHISKSFRFYTGKDIPDAQPICWYAYCIKEHFVSVSNQIFDETELKIEAQVQNKNKHLKRIKSQDIQIKEQEKKDFKSKLFAFIKQNMPDWQSHGTEYYADEYRAFSVTLIKFAIEESRFGIMKPMFLRQYYLEYKTCHAPEKWTPDDVYKFIHR